MQVIALDRIMDSRTNFTLRSEGSPRRTFNVTWQGKRAASGARTR